MPAPGLRLRNAANQVIFDATSRAGRLLGTIDTTSATGSHTDARIAEGDPFASVYVPSQAVGILKHVQVNSAATVTFSGTTLSWSIGSGGLARRIIYGVR